MDSQESDPSVLLNGHFDSPPGSPGAGDCGSCVGAFHGQPLWSWGYLLRHISLDCIISSCAASILEIARLTIDSGWVPPRPVIFLFNGAEELFMLVRTYVHISKLMMKVTIFYLI